MVTPPSNPATPSSKEDTSDKASTGISDLVLCLPRAAKTTGKRSVFRLLEWTSLLAPSQRNLRKEPITLEDLRVLERLGAVWPVFTTARKARPCSTRIRQRKFKIKRYLD